MSRTRRRLSVWALVPLALAFLLIPQTVSLFTFGADTVGGGYETPRTALGAEIVPDFGGALIAIALIWWLGWGRLVWTETLRTRRWVWVVPGALLLYAVAETDYQHLAEVAPSLVLALAVGTLATGLSEELMFRGVALQSLRDRVSEGWAAALSSLLFGSLHLVNAIVYGAGAVPQAILATVFGYYLYLTRRVSGGIVVPVLVHWAYDFAVFSETLGGRELPADSDSALIDVLLTVGLAIVLLIGRRRISPVAEPVAAPVDTSEAPGPTTGR